MTPGTPATPGTTARLAAIVVALAALLVGFLPGIAQANHAGPAYPLATSGNRIVDANGETVIWQGVNWFGLETSNQAPHGLWVRDYRDMVAQIASLGFNTVRLPFSLEALESTTTTGIVYSGGMNADLLGKTPLQVMDAVIAEADRLGLMVILDNHSQANDGYTHDLWFGQAGYTEEDWIAAWEMLARRYADAPHVVAFDLKNEPHGRATWGDGSETDWRLAAERAGNAVLAIAPDKLIVVEGIEGPVEGGQVLEVNWWGGNLQGVHRHPVRLDVPHRIVYSPHEYGPGVYEHSWFTDPDMAAILQQRWSDGFGFIHEQGIAPVFVGEFGARIVDPDTVPGRWLRQFTEYLAKTGTSWTYWSWNPNSGDTGGVLMDDWQTVHADKMEILATLMADATAPALPEPMKGLLKARLVTVASWESGSCYMLRLRNTSDARVHAWRTKMTLPKGASVTSAWNGTVRVKGRRVTITSSKSDPSIVAGTTVQHVGLCTSSSAKPRRVLAEAR